MRTCLIACETVRDELELALSKTGGDYDIYWIESGLHNFPDRLHDCIQETLDRMEAYDTVLMCFGMCGNAMKNIRTKSFRLVIPKVEDCISLLFGSDQKRRDFSSKNAAYFLTAGWMKGERNLWAEYQHSVKRFGERKAKRIAGRMYANYRTLALLDTGAYPFDRLMEETEKIEHTLGLQRMPVKGTLSLIQELLQESWQPEKFYIVEPYSRLE